MAIQVGTIVHVWAGRHDKQGSRSPRAGLVVSLHSDKHCAVVCWDTNGIATFHGNLPIVAADLISAQLPEGPFVQPRPAAAS